MKSIFLSIIIPAYKEAERIGVTLVSLDTYFSNKAYAYEIIVVNDGSPDNLVSVVHSYMHTVRNLRLVDNQINYGKGYAVRCGMNEARGQYCLFMDADNSVTVENLDRFMKAIAAGAEVVIGSIQIGREKKEEHNGFHRRFLSRVSKAPVRIFATPGIYDTQRGFKLFTRNAVNIIFPRQTINRFAFDIELLVIAMANNLKIKELSVAFDNPPGSTVRLSAYLSSLADLSRIIIKKMTGVYTVSPSGLLVPSAAGRTVWVTAMSVFMFSVIIVAGFLVQTGIGIQARAALPESPVVVASTPETTSRFHASSFATAPVWLYARTPMTKQDTAELLILAFVLMLFGADLVSGLILPRLYASIDKAFFTPLPVLDGRLPRHDQVRQLIQPVAV